MGPATTLLELDVDAAAAKVLALHPDLRRVPLAANIATFARAPVLDARLNELNLFATDIGQVTVTAAINALPAVGACRICRHPRQRHQPERRRVRATRSGRQLLARLRLLSGRGDVGPGQSGRRAADRPRKLQDVGRAFADHTVIGDPAISLTQIDAALPTALDLNDVIVGTLDQADFPWEDVDLTTAGLQDFARTGATLDWSLKVSISSARGGPGPFATTVTVTLPPGFRYFTPTPARRRRPRSTRSPRLPGSSADRLSPTARPARCSCGPSPTSKPTPTTRCRSARLPASNSARRQPSPRSRSPTAPPRRQASSASSTTATRRATPRRRCRSQGNVLYLGYVDHADDVDLYGFNSTPSAQVGVRLSHLAGDGDLVVYGPATDTAGQLALARRRPAPQLPSAPPLAADPLDVSGVGYSPEPDTDAGVPVIDGLHGRRTVCGTQHRPRGGRRDRSRSAAGQLVQLVRLEPAVRPARPAGRSAEHARRARRTPEPAASPARCPT